MLEYLNSVIFRYQWPWPLLIAIAFMLLIAVVSYVRKDLNLSGALAVWAMGVMVLYSLRFEGFSIFFVFFALSNVAEKIFRTGKTGKEKNRRNWTWVFVRGFLACVGAVRFFINGNSRALFVFGACTAEAFADTMATIAGQLSRNLPVSIRTFAPQEKGTSGAVSILGCIAGFVSAALIAFMCHSFFRVSGIFPIVLLTGFAGCVMDSVLGACAQAIYKDSDSGKLTETPTSELVRGIRWMDNDMVNFSANLFSCVFALGLSKLTFG